MTTIKAAITQATWTGDKESMLAKHEQFARDAAAEGVQVICFQELFYGPYFGNVQDKKYYELRRAVPRPDHEALRQAGPQAQAGHGAAGLRGGSPASTTTRR